MALKFSFRFNKPIFFLWKAILAEEHWMCSEADCGNGNFLVGTTYKPQTQFWYLKTHTHDVHLTIEGEAPGSVAAKNRKSSIFCGNATARVKCSLFE